MGWTEAIIDPNYLPESRRLSRFSLAHEFHCVDGFNLLLRVLSWAGGERKDVVEVLTILMSLESSGVCLLSFIFYAANYDSKDVLRNGLRMKLVDKNTRR
jgi:hypothetical protein